MKFKNENIVDLGIIDDEQKYKSCWLPLSISGSKVNRMFKEPLKLFNETVTGTRPKFSTATIEKLESGKVMEPIIIDFAKKQLGFDIVVDKRTFKIKDQELYANIDGISPDGDIIYEIKNTEEKDIKKVFERYKWQMVYYCRFFKATKAVLIAYISGCKLRTYEYKPTDEDYETMRQKIHDFNVSVENNTYFPFIKDEDQELGLVDEDNDWILKKYSELQEQKKQIENEMLDLKEKLIEYASKYGCSTWEDRTGNRFKIFKVLKKGGVDIDKLKEANPTLEIPFKDDMEITQFKFTAKKIKE